MAEKPEITGERAWAKAPAAMLELKVRGDLLGVDSGQYEYYRRLLEDAALDEDPSEDYRER